MTGAHASMNKADVVNTLIQSTESIGLIHTIYSIFGKSVKVRIPFGEKTLDSSVDEIDFSVRSSNCLKRTGMMQVRDIVEAIEDERLLKVRNLGKTSYSEIQTKLLALGYSKLSAIEKKQFFYDLLDLNGYAG
jgi:DNA-directed RNA polymerase alpha subunit